jgi:hypothetical protein
MAIRNFFYATLLAVCTIGTAAGESKSDSAKVYRTTNFEVRAPSTKVARQIAKAAERHRKKVARVWLGRELPAWAERCPIHVTLTLAGAGGATSFSFSGGRVQSHSMRINGALELILANVLPHEVSHLILAHRLGRAVPRWADEGGAVCGEGATGRQRHEELMSQLVRGPDRLIPLRRLFVLKNYPRDARTFYAQSYSVARFLIEARDRKTFLAFVEYGMARGWGKGLRKHYGYKNVADLERVWLKKLRGRPALPRVAVKETPERIGPPSPAVSAFGKEAGGAPAKGR